MKKKKTQDFQLLKSLILRKHTPRRKFQNNTEKLPRSLGQLLPNGQTFQEVTLAGGGGGGKGTGPVASFWWGDQTLPSANNAREVCTNLQGQPAHVAGDGHRRPMASGRPAEGTSNPFRWLSFERGDARPTLPTAEVPWPTMHYT